MEIFIICMKKVNVNGGNQILKEKNRKIQLLQSCLVTIFSIYLMRHSMQPSTITLDHGSHIYSIQVVIDQQLFTWKYCFCLTYKYMMFFMSLKFAIRFLSCCHWPCTIYKSSNIYGFFCLPSIYIVTPLFLFCSASCI